MNCNKEMLYDEKYYQCDCGEDYSNREIWTAQFGKVAEEIIERFHPKTVLDAGCAWGYLVEALRDRGVEAYGIDISEYAISQVRSDIKKYCYLGSLANEFPEELPKNFDLITNIEILEHLSEKDGIIAIKNLCSKTNRVLFSSTDHDFAEPTHINVKPIEYWVELFAKNSFYHNFLNDTKSISEWAVCLEKKQIFSDNMIAYYEKMYREKEENFKKNEDEFSAKIVEKDGEIARLNSVISQKDSIIRQKDSAIKLAEDNYDSILKSTSWRITKPLRLLKHIVFKK